MAQPQPKNRFQESYDSFYNTTPLTTRMVLTSTTVTYLASFLYDPTFILANIPAFTLLKIQLYRIFTSSFICTELLSLVFAFLSFLDCGKRIESGIGSTNFAVVLLSITGITNMIHNGICLIGYFLTSKSEFLLIPSFGIWNLILAVIAMECATADPSSQRRLFVVDVPTRYYPCVLLGFFFLLSGGQIHLSYFISVGVGYLVGFGKLDFIKLHTERRQRLEAGVLRKFTSKVGFVAGPNSNHWTLTTASIASGEGNANGYSSGHSNDHQQWESSNLRSNAFNTSWSVPTFAGTTGNRLGSATGVESSTSTSTSTGTTRSRPNATATQSSPARHTTVDRSVLLAAAERRATASVVNATTIDEEKGN